MSITLGEQGRPTFRLLFRVSTTARKEWKKLRPFDAHDRHRWMTPILAYSFARMIEAPVEAVRPSRCASALGMSSMAGHCQIRINTMFSNAGAVAPSHNTTQHRDWPNSEPLTLARTMSLATRNPDLSASRVSQKGKLHMPNLWTLSTIHSVYCFAHLPAPSHLLPARPALHPGGLKRTWPGADQRAARAPLGHCGGCRLTKNGESGSSLRWILFP